MSDLSSNTRGDLFKKCKVLDIKTDTKDTKQSLIDKITKSCMGNLTSPPVDESGIFLTHKSAEDLGIKTNSDNITDDSLINSLEEAEKRVSQTVHKEPAKQVVETGTVPGTSRRNIQPQHTIQKPTPHEKQIYVSQTIQTSDEYDIDDVIEECNAMFSGRALAKYTLDNPSCIEFRGGPRQAWDITIKQPKKNILMHARTFCSRALVGPGNTGRMGDRGNPQNINIDSLSPAERDTLLTQLNSVR